MIFCLATGAAVAFCIDVLNTHDIKLARKLYQFLKPLDILLGDRAFCAYADLVAIKKLDGDAVFRLGGKLEKLGQASTQTNYLVTSTQPTDKACPVRVEGGY